MASSPRTEHLGKPNAMSTREAKLRPSNTIFYGNGLGQRLSDTQADVPSAKRLRAQLAFKDSMVRGILQFTPSIAFRCVLHRCESRDIRCRESFRVSKYDASLSRTVSGAIRLHDLLFAIPWRVRRRGFVSRLRTREITRAKSCSHSRIPLSKPL